MARGKQAKRTIRTFDGARISRRTDYLTVEEPLEIQLRAGGERRVAAITMRTPGNDYELAAGFLYTEGLIAAKPDITQMIYCTDGDAARQEYNALAVYLHRAALPDLPSLDRHFFTNSACGVCGRVMLDELADRELPALGEGPRVTPATLADLPATLRQAQPMFDATGGLHAAALMDVDGTLLAVREDVGRHNALDKLVGWALLNGHLPFTDKLIMVSGRASYELLYKARIAGAPILCAVSAPSSLAVDLAERFGMTLIGFLRGARFNVYTGDARVSKPAAMQ
ncbi:MAG: formate dehydrogenase accessory sulfurtransferase FdhD [Caldilineaceae bacterium]